ncbi:Abi-alpha family protein [Nocardia sp. NPDC024068]|uniref:Abi-alpha family protein n=1 Tax=Nocardia sp. NPDC024068 TaxID=3157197 RepID=UPI0033D8E6ED
MAVNQEPEETGTSNRPHAPGGPAATVRAVGGVARVAVSAVSGTASWGVHTALDVTETVVRGSMAGLPPAEIRTAAARQVREALRSALGVTASDANTPGGSRSERSLREQGAALLRLAASPQDPDEGHPAFARILAELTSDEARILRLLRVQGPQPAVTVRGGRSSRRGARTAEPRITPTDLGMSMIAENAGLRHPDRVHRYLANLRRIGLLEAIPDAVGTPERYQLLEAQSAVTDLLKQAGGRGRLQHRGIALTPFGSEFVQASLPIAGEEGPAAGIR